MTHADPVRNGVSMLKPYARTSGYKPSERNAEVLGRHTHASLRKTPHQLESHRSSGYYDLVHMEGVEGPWRYQLEDFGADLQMIARHVYEILVYAGTLLGFLLGVFAVGRRVFPWRMLRGIGVLGLIFAWYSSSQWD